MRVSFLQDVDMELDIEKWSSMLLEEIGDWAQATTTNPRSTNPLTGKAEADAIRPWEVMQLTKEGRSKELQPAFKVVHGSK